MSKYSIEDTTLTAIADSIRSKAGTSGPILVSGFADAITAIPTGGSSALDFITNETDYAVAIYTKTTANAAESITLPDGVTWDRVKMIMFQTPGEDKYGTSEGLEVATSIYCPDLYNKQLTDSSGNIYYACFGGYRSENTQSLDYVRGWESYDEYDRYQQFSYLMYDEATNQVLYYYSTTHSYTAVSPISLEPGYILGRHAYAAVFYDQRGLTA